MGLTLQFVIIFPVKALAPTEKETREEIEEIRNRGSIPDRELIPKLMSNSELRWAREDGTEPLSRLLDKYKYWRASQFPNEPGIEPLRKLN